MATPQRRPEVVAFGELLATIRKLRGLKQAAAAKRLGIELKTYQMWEQGRVEVRQRHLARIAEVYRVPPALLIEPDPAAARAQLVALMEAEHPALQRRSAEAGSPTADQQNQQTLETLPEFLRLKRQIEQEPTDMPEPHCRQPANQT
jgi:transcriptional regulator with XRE-family HTH domain